MLLDVDNGRDAGKGDTCGSCGAAPGSGQGPQGPAHTAAAWCAASWPQRCACCSAPPHLPCLRVMTACRLRRGLPQLHGPMHSKSYIRAQTKTLAMLTM